LVIKFEISWLSEAILFFCGGNGKEEWSAFHQYLPFLETPSGTISVLDQPSFPQTLQGESLPQIRDFLVIKSNFVCFWWKWKGRMVSIPPIFTLFGGKTK
jgi:hypothetical protein